MKRATSSPPPTRKTQPEQHRRDADECSTWGTFCTPTHDHVPPLRALGASSHHIHTTTSLLSQQHLPSSCHFAGHTHFLFLQITGELCYSPSGLIDGIIVSSRSCTYC